MGKLGRSYLINCCALFAASRSSAFVPAKTSLQAVPPLGATSIIRLVRSSPCARVMNAEYRGRVRAGQRIQQSVRRGVSSPLKLQMLDPGTALVSAADVSAWSVTSSSADVSANLFALSLIPYLAFLFFLSRPETKTPQGGIFGFGFLLVFVLATIPAGIYAKTEYNAILADVDYLHGLAESFLTLTNLFIVAAFRKAVLNANRQGPYDGEGAVATGERESILRSSPAASGVAILAAATLMLSSAHAEPANALSFPTWMVHVSSLIEWLAAMTYVWRYADVVGLPEWKGLTWGMLPLHTSGLIACTYHIFYNSPQLTALVAMQAAMTCFGNSTMAFATWKVWQAGKLKWRGGAEEGLSAATATSAEGGRSSSSWSEDFKFYGQLLGLTAAGAALVKWGELFLDFPFQPTYAAAALLILGPTILNAKKWSDRSAEPSGPIEGTF